MLTIITPNMHINILGSGWESLNSQYRLQSTTQQNIKDLCSLEMSISRNINIHYWINIQASVYCTF